MGRPRVRALGIGFATPPAMMLFLVVLLNMMSGMRVGLAWADLHFNDEQQFDTVTNLPQLRAAQGHLKAQLESLLVQRDEKAQRLNEVQNRLDEIQSERRQQTRPLRRPPSRLAFEDDTDLQEEAEGLQAELDSLDSQIQATQVGLRMMRDQAGL